MATAQQLADQVASIARAVNSRGRSASGPGVEIERADDSALVLDTFAVPSAQSFTASVLASNTLTADLSLGYPIRVLLDGNLIMGAPTNIPSVGTIVPVILVQDSTGGRTASWNAAWGGVFRYVPRKGPSGVSVFWFVSTGAALSLLSASAIDTTAPVDVVDGYGCKFSGNSYTGVDAATAVQAAINDGYDVFLPAGTYSFLKPIWQKPPLKRIIGAGKSATVINSDHFSGAGLYLVPQYTGLPTTTALATGAGAAAIFTGGGYPYYLGLSENIRINLDGKSAFTVDFYLRVDGDSGATNAIISCGGSQVAGGASVGTFSIGHSAPSGGRVTLGGSCHIGGSPVSLNSGSTTLAVGTTYHIEVSYDGAHVRLFVGGVLAQSVAATGTVDQPTYACWTIGVSTTNIFEANVITSSPYCAIDSVRISEAARHTSAFTPPTAKFTFDSSTLFLHNFDNEQGQFSVAKSRSANNTTASDHYILLRRTTDAAFGGTIGAGVFDLTWNAVNNEGVAYYNRWVTDHTVERCIFGGSVCFADNAYKQTLKDVYVSASAGARYGLMFGNACGVFVARNIRVTGAKYGVLTLASGGKFDGVGLELNSTSEVGALQEGGTVEFANLSIDDETASSPLWQTGLLVSSADLCVVSGGDLDCRSYAVPPITVSGPTSPVRLDNVALAVHANSQEIVKKGEVDPGAGAVFESGCQIFGSASSAPWSNTSGLVVHVAAS
jgi:hypothetical protein